MADLLPAARLVPVADPHAADDSRLLATLPVRLERGALPGLPEAGWTPLRISLVVAWACVLVAATCGS